MKTNPTPNIPAVEPEWDDSFDAEDARDVWFPADPDGALSAAVRLRFRFGSSGYKVTMASKPSPHHDVWLVKALRRSAPQFPDDATFLAHVHEILRLADFRLPKANVLAQQSSARILVCFTVPRAPVRKKKAKLRRLLDELP